MLSGVGTCYRYMNFIQPLGTIPLQQESTETSVKVLSDSGKFIVMVLLLWLELNLRTKGTDAESYSIDRPT